MHKTYLKNVVMSASPEQLHLMLYDGAIRFALQAKDAMEAGKIEETHNLLSRAQRILLEMQNGLRPEVDPVLCERMGALYTFCYLKLVNANVNKDVSDIEDALQVLRFQRETWATLCDRLQKDLADPDSEAIDSDQPFEGCISLEG